MSKTPNRVRPRVSARRNLLRLLGCCGALLPAEVLASHLLPGAADGQVYALLSRRRSGPPKPSSSPGFALADVANQAGLGGAINVYGGVQIKRYLMDEMGCGVAFFDYDHDGWVDIFLVSGTRFEGLPPGAPPSNFLFHNNRDGSFTDVTRKAGLMRSGWGQGCCVGDYDDDGFDDLFLTYWGQNVLYHNNGVGTVTDVTEKAGLIQKGSRPRWNTGCCFVDYDRDGRVDLFIAEYVNFDPALAPLPGANRLCTFYSIPVACGPQGLGGGTNILYHNR